MSTLIQKIAIAGAPIAVVLGFSSVTFAQSVLPVSKPFRVKVGVFLPKDGDVKDAVGKTFLAGGVSFDYNKSGTLTPTIYNVYADYTSKSNNGAKLDVWSVGLASRFTLATPVIGHPYVETGLGYYTVKAQSNTTINGATVSDSETKGRFGGKLAAGYELPNGFFGEVEYTYISKVNDFDPSGYRAYLGFRF